MGSSLLEEPICCGLGSYVAVRVLLVYEGLLHYFLPYLCHYSLTLDGGEWKVRDFKGYLSSSGRSGHSGNRGEGQCAQSLLLSCTDGVFSLRGGQG